MARRPAAGTTPPGNHRAQAAGSPCSPSSPDTVQEQQLRAGPSNPACESSRTDELPPHIIEPNLTQPAVERRRYPSPGLRPNPDVATTSVDAQIRRQAREERDEFFSGLRVVFSA